MQPHDADSRSRNFQFLGTFHATTLLSAAAAVVAANASAIAAISLVVFISFLLFGCSLEKFAV